MIFVPAAQAKNTKSATERTPSRTCNCGSPSLGDKPKGDSPCTLCHPDRSGGICSSPSLADEPKVHSPSTLCHPDRSGGICGCSLCRLKSLFSKTLRNLIERKIRGIGFGLIPPVLENATVTERNKLALGDAELFRLCVNPLIRAFELGIDP
jgi:hypothetical protein